MLGSDMIFFFYDTLEVSQGYDALVVLATTTLWGVTIIYSLIKRIPDNIHYEQIITFFFCENCSLAETLVHVCIPA